MEQSKDVWKDKTFLVMNKEALLPYRCVKTNNPTNGQCVSLKLQWHSPVKFFIGVAAVCFLMYLRLGMILWTILMLPIMGVFFVPKRLKIEMGISEEIVKKQNRAIKISRGFFAIGLVPIVAGIALFDQQPAGIIIIFSGLLLFAIGAICRADGANPIALKRVKGDYVWLSGVNEDYLSVLPDWSQRQA